MLKSIRELEFETSIGFINYKRDRLWHEWVKAEFVYYICFDHMFKQSKSNKAALSKFGVKVKLRELELSVGVGDCFTFNMFLTNQ